MATTRAAKRQAEPKSTALLRAPPLLPLEVEVEVEEGEVFEVGLEVGGFVFVLVVVGVSKGVEVPPVLGGKEVTPGTLEEAEQLVDADGDSEYREFRKINEITLTASEDSERSGL